MRGNSKTLIDSVFSNAISPNVIPDKLTSSTSDHLPQFLKAPNIFFNPTSSKSKMYERDWTKFDQETFILDYFSIDWDQTLCIQSNDIDKSCKSFLDKFNSLLDLRAPYKKLPSKKKKKKKLRFTYKPWIASSIQKSISIENHYLSKFIKLKCLHITTEAQNKCQQYRNLTSTLLKRTKLSYFTNFFQVNIKNLKSTSK